MTISRTYIRPNPYFYDQNVNAYTLVAKTDDDKRKWMTAIQEALHNVYPTPRYSHDVSMCTFEEPTACQFCSKLLKGLFYQV